MKCAHCKAAGPDVFPVDGDHAVCAGMREVAQAYAKAS